MVLLPQVPVQDGSRKMILAVALAVASGGIRVASANSGPRPEASRRPLPDQSTARRALRAKGTQPRPPGAVLTATDEVARPAVPDWLGGSVRFCKIRRPCAEGRRDRRAV